MRAHAAREQGVAVGRRRCDACAADGAAGAADILDYHLLSQPLDMLSATMRATTSLGPPAGKGTTTVIGRVG